MKPRLLLLDFDGTCTDAFAEAEPFFAGYKPELAAAAGVGTAELDDLWARFAAEINAEPGRRGWTVDGPDGPAVVAPAGGDPYITATTIAQLVLDAVGVAPEPASRRALLERLYRDNYRRAGTVFRPETKRVIEALAAGDVPVRIVTNSHTDAVAAKLAALGARGSERIRVVGGAMKAVLAEPATPDPRFDPVPAVKRVPGLDRPVMLRRGRYFSVLAGLLDEAGVTTDETLFAGDLYELDLALPAAVGMAVHLVAKPRTAPYERAATLAEPRGAVSDDLTALLAYVG